MFTQIASNVMNKFIEYVFEENSNKACAIDVHLGITAEVH
jgi:hypothetical protein